MAAVGAPRATPGTIAEARVAVRDTNEAPGDVGALGPARPRRELRVELRRRHACVCGEREVVGQVGAGHGPEEADQDGDSRVELVVAQAGHITGLGPCAPLGGWLPRDGGDQRCDEGGPG